MVSVQFKTIQKDRAKTPFCHKKIRATFLCYFSVVGKHIYQIERERVTYTSKTGFYWLTSAHYGVIVDNDDYSVQPGVLSIEFIV